jgi:hypothetical protein
MNLNLFTGSLASSLNASLAPPCVASISSSDFSSSSLRLSSLQTILDRPASAIALHVRIALQMSCASSSFDKTSPKTAPSRWDMSTTVERVCARSDDWAHPLSLTLRRARFAALVSSFMLGKQGACPAQF